MPKKKQKNPAVTITRRDGDVHLSDDAKEQVERFLGGKVRVQAMARELAENETLENVRVVLAQTTFGKMIVVKRAGDLADLLAASLPKLRMKKCNAVYVEGSPPVQIFDTLELPDDSRLVFKFERKPRSHVVKESDGPLAEEQEEEQAKEVKSDDFVVVENEEVEDEEEEIVVDEGADDDDGEEEEDPTPTLDNVIVSENTDAEEVDVEIVASDIYQRAKQVLFEERGLKQPTASPRPVMHSINFSSVRSSRTPLPIDKSETELVQAIRENSVTIVRAPTGSGKSTRLVQYILESSPTANIVVTEPRRIAAMSVSDRVASELKTRLGGVVGYSVRTERQTSSATQVLFCTVGVLLRRLAHDTQLSGVTHVVVDEAHERDVLTDLLLIFVKDLLTSGSRPDLKIVVLSATMDSSAFKDYFAVAPFTAKEISVEGMTYPVEVFFQEQLDRMVGRRASVKGRESSHSSAASYRAELDVELVARLVDFYLRSQAGKTNKSDKRRSILIFVSGRKEILRTMSKLGEDVRLEVYPLHSSLSSEEQRRVFRPSSDTRKTRVIVATNVAETSITIDDCGLVIDSGKFKQSRYDADSRTWHLEETQISRSAMIQRRGRAGRTAPGCCYHLFTESLELDEQPKPGMLKDSLEEAIMAVKAAKGSSADSYKFFARALSPPPSENVQRILEDLNDLGVIRGIFSSTSDATELTPLGYHLAKLGTDCRTGKLLLFGCFFDCLDPILTVASVLDGKSPFSLGGIGGRQTDKQQIRRFFGPNDFQAFVKAREVFLSSSSEFSQLRTMLSPTAMRLNEKIRDDFVQDLKGAGFLQSAEEVADYSRFSRDWRIVRICLAAGLFPHVGRVEWDGAIVSGPHQLEKSSMDPSTVWLPPPPGGNPNAIAAQTANKKGKGKHKAVVVPSRFFVFHERTRLGDANGRGGHMSLRRAIDVSPISLVLFGGGFTRVRSKRRDPLAAPSRFVTIRLGNCWMLQARIKDAFLLMQLRRVVDESMLNIYERKSLNEKDEALLKLIREIAV